MHRRMLSPAKSPSLRWHYRKKKKKKKVLGWDVAASVDFLPTMCYAEGWSLALHKTWCGGIPTFGRLRQENHWRSSSAARWDHTSLGYMKACLKDKKKRGKELFLDSFLRMWSLPHRTDQVISYWCMISIFYKFAFVTLGTFKRKW